MTSTEEIQRLTIAGGEVINDVPSNIKQSGVIAFQNFELLGEADDLNLFNEPEILNDELQNSDVFDIDFMFSKVEYNPDEEDMRYIHKFNKSVKNNVNITVDLFSQLMDRFEKLAVFEFYRTGNSVVHAKKPIIISDCCDVCGSNQDSRNNKVVRCQYCYVCVHQECYGILFVPIDKWTCRRCGIHPTLPVKCALCPFEGGAMKFTTSNSAIHQLCAIWVNDVTLGPNSAMEPIDIKVNTLNKYRCDLCGITYGSVIRCSVPDCEENYHVTCAAIARVIMEIEMNNADGLKYIRRMYCFNHSKIPSYEAQKRIAKVKEWTKIGDDGKRYCPIDIRARPISQHYLKPEYINPNTSIELISAVYEYWLVKRLRTFGIPTLQRMKIIYDRLADPSRGLKYGTIPEVNRAARMRVNVVPDGKGQLKIVGNFASHIDVYNDIPVRYIQNCFSNDPNDFYVDIESNTVVERGRRLFVNEIYIESIEQKLIICNNLKQSKKYISEIVRQYIDPEMNLVFDDNCCSDDISPWDVIGIMFFVCCPINIQVIAFANALRILDDKGMFLHFNRNTPNHVNISTICRKALSNGYDNIQFLIDDVHRMLLPINSPFVKNQRLAYAKRFEECVCYLLLPKPYGRVIDEMLRKLKTSSNKYKILLHHLLHQLTDFENKDPILKTLSEEDRNRLQVVTDYVRHVIINEKKNTIPNLELTADLFRRRQINSQDDELIMSSNCGFSLILSERAFDIKEVMLKPKFKLSQLSWNQCFKSLMNNEVKDSALNEIERKIFNINGIKIECERKMSLQKRTNGDQIEQPTAKRRKLQNGTQNVKITNFLSKNHNNELVEDKKNSVKNKKVPLALFCPSTKKTRDTNYVKYYHDTIVIVNQCSQGEHYIGKIIDPRVIKKYNPGEYDYIMKLSHAGWKHYSCISLFLGNDKHHIEWINNSLIKIVNMIKLSRYIEENDECIEDSITMQNFKAAVDYYLSKTN